MKRALDAYCAYVRPIADYGLVVACQETARKLSITRRKIIRMITNVPIGSANCITWDWIP